MPSQSDPHKKGIASLLSVIAIFALAVVVIISGQLVSRKEPLTSSKAATANPYGVGTTAFYKAGNANGTTTDTVNWTPFVMPSTVSIYTRMVMVTVAYEYVAAGTYNVTNVTYCGTAMTKAADRTITTTDTKGVSMWYIVNPNVSNTCQVSVTFSRGGIYHRYIISATYFDALADTNSVTDGHYSSNTSGTAQISDTRPGPKDSIEVCAYDTTRTSTATITPISPITQFGVSEFTDSTMGSNYMNSALGRSSIRTVDQEQKTVGWTMSQLNPWSLACANIKVHPSVIGTPPPTTPPSSPTPPPTTPPSSPTPPLPTPTPTPNCSVYIPLPAPANVKVGGLTGNPINISSGAKAVTWDSVAGAVRYQVIVNNKEDSVGFAGSNCATQYPLDTCANGLTTPSYNYSFLANRNYQVEVRAINSCGYTGDATLKEVTVGTLIQPTNGLTAVYYPTIDFTSIPSLPNFSRRDRPLDIYWDNNATPLLGFPKDFSVEWTGKVQALGTGGNYKFELVADDQATVYWNSAFPLYGDASKGFPRVWTVSLAADTKYTIKIRYKNSSNEGQIQLWWTPPGGTRQIVPASKLFPQ